MNKYHITSPHLLPSSALSELKKTASRHCHAPLLVHVRERSVVKNESSEKYQYSKNKSSKKNQYSNEKFSEKYQHSKN
jgi:hypothetical protein